MCNKSLKAKTELTLKSGSEWFLQCAVMNKEEDRVKDTVYDLKKNSLQLTILSWVDSHARTNNKHTVK